MIRSLLLTFCLTTVFSLSLYGQLLPVLTPDTTICPGESVQLAVPPTAPTGFSYQWTPSTGLNNDTLAAPVASPTVTTKYFLTVTSADGTQTETDSVTLTVRSVAVTIIAIEEELCIGDTLSLGAIPTGGPPTTLNWFSSNGTVTGADSLTFAPYVPTETETFIATFSAQGCTVRDTLTVFVDSLPASAIEADPMKEIYCPGDTIILKSETYQPQNFPALEAQWSPSLGFETADTLWNMIITAQDSTTTTYFREINNRGCNTLDSITIAVDTPLVLSPALASICPGESVQIEIVKGFKPEGTLSWTPNTSLSCPDCPDPVASPLVTTIYEVQQSDVACPESAQATVSVQPAPLRLVSDTICEGEFAILNQAPNPLATYTWTSVPTDTSLVSNIPDPIVSPTETTTYTVTAEINGCVFTESVTITVLLLQANLQVTPFPDTTVVSGGTATLLASSGLDIDETFQWQLNPGGILIGPEQIIEDVTSSIDVALFYSNICANDTITTRILIQQVLVPGAFTPNGDGDNDFFNIVSTGDPVITQFSVWNRWGQQVYNNETPNQGWDGQFNDSPAPADVYVFRVLVELPDGTLEEFKGDVTLIR